MRGTRDLPPRVVDAFRAPDHEVYLSAASAWEIAVKYALGRLPLPEPPEHFVPAERDAHAISPLPIDEESALHLSWLPTLHRDPFDRMLVSQAIIHGLTILTPDPLISQYSRAHDVVVGLRTSFALSTRKVTVAALLGRAG